MPTSTSAGLLILDHEAQKLFQGLQMLSSSWSMSMKQNKPTSSQGTVRKGQLWLNEESGNKSTCTGSRNA